MYNLYIVDGYIGLNIDRHSFKSLVMIRKISVYYIDLSNSEN